MRIRITLMRVRIRILLFTLIRIRILPFTLMRIQILPFNLMMRIQIRILPLTFLQMWTFQCSKITVEGSTFSR